MLIATHSIVAGTVSSQLNNPLLAFLLGIIIHFLLDSIPHYDTTDGGEMTKRQFALVAVDALIGFCVIFLVLKPPLNWHDSFWWGMIGGNTPDFFDNFPGVKPWYRKSQIGSKIHAFHKMLQSYWKQPSFVLGIAIQIILIGLFSFIYINSKH